MLSSRLSAVSTFIHHVRWSYQYISLMVCCVCPSAPSTLLTVKPAQSSFWPRLAGEKKKAAEEGCDGPKCMSRDVVYVCLYLVSTVRSDAAGDDAVIQQTSHYLRHFQASRL